MRAVPWLLAFLVVTVTACASQPVEPAAVSAPDSDSGKRLPGSFGDSAREARVAGEYIVGLMAGADPAPVREGFTGYGVKEWRLLREDTYLLRLQQDPGPAVMAEAAKSSPGIRYIEPNRIYTVPR